MYVPLGPGRFDSPDVLDGLDSMDLLAIDDVDRVAGDGAWERALFAVFEAFAIDRGGLLLGASARPAETPFALPDLASRAAATTVYRLEPLDDEARIDALVDLAHRRGLEIDESAARFLLERIERDMHAVRHWLDKLDQASLAARRRLTTRFIAEQLARAPVNDG